MKKFFRFFISRQFLLNLGLIIIVWIGLIWFVFRMIKSHTGYYDDPVAVPSLYKFTEDEVDMVMKERGLKYEIQDSVYLDGWPKGTICWQYPLPTDSTHMFVKPGRTVYLSIVPMNPKMIALPKLVDMSKRMAETTLAALGLKTKITYRPAVEGKDFVLAQLVNGKEIKTGAMVPKGTRVELVVAQGKTGETTALPNMVGLTIKEAKERLLNLTLTLHSECEDCVTEMDIENAVIVNQSPAGGEMVNVPAGTTVTIWAKKSN